jgi:hypothetical protein
VAKSEFDKFTSIEKYAQLLLNERIRQSQKFDEEGFHYLTYDVRRCFVNALNGGLDTTNQAQCYKKI